MGGKVVLTPESGDEGVDVLAILNEEVLYIQAKHSKYPSAYVDIDKDTKDFSRGYEFYENNVFKGRLNKLKRREILLTNKNKKGMFSGIGKGIELWGPKKIRKLLNEHQITYQDIISIENERLKNLDDCFDRLV